MGCVQSSSEPMPDPEEFLVPRDDSAMVDKTGNDANVTKQGQQATTSTPRNSTGWLMKLEDIDIDGGGVGGEPMSPVFIAPPDKTWSTYRLPEPWSESYDGSVEVGTMSLRNDVGRVQWVVHRPSSTLLHSTHSFHKTLCSMRGASMTICTYTVYKIRVVHTIDPNIEYDTSTIDPNVASLARDVRNRRSFFLSFF